MDPSKKYICVGKIIAAHGIKGMVKIFSHAENPDTLTKLGPLSDAKGKRVFIVTKTQPLGKALLASIEGVTDRNAAEALKDTDLYLPREKLPPLPEGKFYYTDLIGLEARDTSGKKLGVIHALHNYGAGDIFEIKPNSGESFLIPFTPDVVKKIDAAAGTVEIDRPEEV